MRSRASGGTCGDSVAAASAATMSSLRRRAIWVQRAMSTERSSIGGRASARTTAPASVGSASSRSQASRSRISARWKNAASPTSRWAIARSSSATLDRLALVRDLGDEHGDHPAGHPLARQQALDVDRHRLGLGALVGTPPELARRRRRRRRTVGVDGSRPSAAVGGLPDPLGTPLRPVRARSPDTVRTRPLEAAHPRGPGPAEAPQTAVGVAGDGHAAARQTSSASVAGARSSSWASSISRWSEAPGEAGLRASQRQRVRRSGRRRRERPPRPASARGCSRSRRTRARARPPGSSSGRRAGPGRVLLGRRPARPSSRSIRRTNPPEQRVGPPAEVVVAQRQLVDALDQHGQPVPGGQHRVERIGAGPRGAQAPRPASSAGVSTNSSS